MDDVALIGYRGYREWDPELAPAEQIPENSIAAFERSYGEKGLDGIGLGVHLSRDDQLVVFHDDELNELTNVTDLLRQPIPDPATRPDPLADVNGVDLTRLRALQANDPAGRGNIYIADLALGEIQALRLKSHPDGTGVRHTTAHAIPTLTEVFRAVDLSRANNPEDPGKFQINIEVKEALPTESGSHRMTGRDIAGALTRTIDDFLNAEPAPQVGWSKADHLMVSSFHQMTLGRLRHADPQIPRRALYSTSEAEFAAQFATDANLPIEDLRGAPLHDAAGKQLLGVAPGSVAISISALTPRVAQTIRDSGAAICVWRPNEQSTALRPRALLNFLEQEQVTAFISDNSASLVQERAAWRAGKSRDEVAERGQPQTATRRTRSPSPTPPEPPQRRRRNSIPLIPEGLPNDARAFNPDGSTPGSAYRAAMFGNGLSQTVAMCVAYGVALSYIQAFASRVIPIEDATIGKKVFLAAVQGLVQAPLLAVWEESLFGFAAEAGAAALGGGVVARSDPYPEFKLPPVPGNAAQAGLLEALRAHNSALEYARTHGGMEPTYEARNHPFSKLVRHPEPDAQNYVTALANYNGQVELRRKAEGILRNRPIELSDYPLEHDLAPRHVRDERRQWLADRHNTEVAYANDLLRRPEYASLNIEPIPARGANSYDTHVREVRGFLQQRSRELAVARLAFAHDQRSADYGSFPIDIVLIGSFALFAGISAAAVSPGLLQTTPGTTVAGTIFGALNNHWRLQNRHRPGELTDAPDGRGARDDIELAERGVARRGSNARDTDSIPTHYVREGRGLQHGWEVFQEIWNGISDSERLSDGVLGARDPWEKARNHAQQLLSYVIGSSYGLVAYNVVRTGIDHAVGGSQGRWQSFLRETAATAAFVGAGDLAILHYSVYGRRGVTGTNPAYAATREAFVDLWKTATGRQVYSTVDRNMLAEAVNRAYDVLQKLIRVTQHGVMDTANLAVTPLIGPAAAEQRSADAREWYGRNVGQRTVYGQLPYKEKEHQEIDRAARTSAIESLSADKTLSDTEAANRLQVLRAQADNFWDAERRLEDLWKEIGPTLPQGQQPGARLLDGWQPTEEQLVKCEKVLQELKEARDAIDTLRRAEINVRQARNERATEVELTSIVNRLAEIPAGGHATTDDVTELLRRPASGMDHKTFETMLNKVIGQNPATAQLNRQDLLAKGYQGINERAAKMVSEVMADLLKKGKQDTNDVAAVIETLVDDARRTGMTEDQFNTIIRNQFQQAATGASDEETARLTNAQPVIAGRTRQRYTELGGPGLDDRRRNLDNLEQELDGRMPTTNRPGGWQVAQR